MMVMLESWEPLTLECGDDKITEKENIKAGAGEREKKNRR